MTVGAQFIWWQNLNIFWSKFIEFLNNSFPRDSAVSINLPPIDVGENGPLIDTEDVDDNGGGEMIVTSWNHELWLAMKMMIEPSRLYECRTDYSVQLGTTIADQ